MSFYQDECGRCGTELVPFSRVYEAGTFSGNVAGSVSGTMWAADGLHSYNHNYNSPVVMQNELARRCAPPEAPFLSGWTTAAALSIVYIGGQLYVVPVIANIIKFIIPGDLVLWKLPAIGFALLWIAAAVITSRYSNLRFWQGLLALCCPLVVWVLGLIGLVKYLSIRPGYWQRRAVWEQSHLCPRCGQEYLCSTISSG